MKERKNRYAKAVALEYDGSSSAAPLIGAKGENWIAEQIVKTAKRYNIPVVERPELARALSEVETDQEIPEDLFEAVALVLNQIEQ